MEETKKNANVRLYFMECSFTGLEMALYSKSVITTLKPYAVLNLYLSHLALVLRCEILKA